MAHHKQSAKRARQNDAIRARNKNQRSEMRTHLKRVNEAISSGDKAKAQQELVVVQARIDKAAKRRIIHPNTASRKKSQLARRIQAMS